jgi:hypothetical protein
MHQFLWSIGCSVNPADSCVFHKRGDADLVTLCLYVDDLLIFCANMDVLTACTRELSTQYAVEDLGPAKQYLGMSIIQTDHPALVGSLLYIVTNAISGALLHWVPER